MNIEKFSKKCGKIIQENRKKHHLSQEELALKSGLSRTFISRLERGLRQPSLYSVFLLSKAFKIKPSRIVIQVESV